MMDTLYVGTVSGDYGDQSVVTRVVEVTKETVGEHSAWFNLELIEWANETVVRVRWNECSDAVFPDPPIKRQELLGINDPLVVVNIVEYGYVFYLEAFASKAEAEEWNRSFSQEILPEFEDQDDEVDDLLADWPSVERPEVDTWDGIDCSPDPEHDARELEEELVEREFKRWKQRARRH